METHKHVWKKLCLVPDSGECPWCDRCTVCNIYLVETWKGSNND
jgi:hypothetical protein